MRKNIYDGSIYGAGITDAFKSIGRKIFGRTVKNAAKSAAKSAAKKAATTTGEYVGKKAGDMIVKLLSKNKTVTPSIRMEPKELTAYMEPKELTAYMEPKELTAYMEPKELTAYEVNQRKEEILSKHIIYDKLSKSKVHRKV